MAIPTVEDFENGKLDLDSLAGVVNGDSLTTVLTRLGVSIPSLSKSAADLIGALTGVPVADDIPAERVEIVAGTIKQDPGTPANWPTINDSEHQPLGVSGIPAASGNLLTINFSKTYSRVISFVCGADETFAEKLGLSVGASVGLSSATLRCGSQFNSVANIHWDGAVWQKTAPSGQDYFTVVTTQDSSTVRVQTAFQNGACVTINPWTQGGSLTNPLIPVIKDVVTGQITDIQFIDPTTGSVVATTPSTRNSFTRQKSHDGPVRLDGINSPIPAGNIWFFGMFVV